METIKNYLDTMFASLPRTPEICKLKEDLLCNMEDKYNELKLEGKSENEAIGIVISEFGNIDELFNELGIDTQVNNKSETLPLISLQQAEKILSDKKLYGTIIGIGVTLCIMAPAIFMIIDSYLESKYISSSIAMFPFFIMIASAVGLFIFSGFQLKKYDYIENSFRLDSNSKKEISGKKECYQTSYILQIIFGVMLCILSPLVFVTLEYLDLSRNGFQNIDYFLLFLFIAIAVFLFIHAGSIMNSYKELLQEEEYFKQYNKKNKLVDAVASVVWPIITAGYLLWSFLSGDWGFTWIVWPISGILFGAFSAICHFLGDGNK